MLLRNATPNGNSTSSGMTSRDFKQVSQQRDRLKPYEMKRNQSDRERHDEFNVLRERTEAVEIPRPAQKRRKHMSNNPFNQPISIDRAPEGRLCEWCNKLAVQQLTAIGGPMHNKGGYFCQRCGEAFAHAVNRSMRKESSPKKDCRPFRVPAIVVHVHPRSHSLWHAFPIPAHPMSQG
jgi:hypothetical protein